MSDFGVCKSLFFGKNSVKVKISSDDDLFLSTGRKMYNREEKRCESKKVRK